MLSLFLRPVTYPAIDGLRFLAAFAVVMVHLVGQIGDEYLRVPSETWAAANDPLLLALWYLSDGHHGVDIFFVISGFLIGRVLFSKRGFKYTTFISQRALRIYPAFVVSLIGAVAVALGLGYTFDFGSFLGNLVFLNAFNVGWVYPYNPISWSLGYEFLFYLVIPLVLLACKFMPKLLATMLMVVAAAIILDFTFYRMLGLFLGCVLATLSDDLLKKAANSIPLWMTLIIYEIPLHLKFVPHLLPDFINHNYWVRYMLILIGIVVLFVKVSFSKNALSDTFSHRMVRYLGTISYSIYLWHLSVLNTSYHFILVPLGFYGSPTKFIILHIVISACGIVAVSTISYLLFERFYFANKSANEALSPTQTRS